MTQLLLRQDDIFQLQKLVAYVLFYKCLRLHVLRPLSILI